MPPAAAKATVRRFDARTMLASLTLAFAIAVSLAPSGAVAGETPNKLLVKFRPGTSQSAVGRTLERAGARPAGAIAQLDVRVVTVASGRAAEASKRLRSSQNVQFVERDSIFVPQ